MEGGKCGDNPEFKLFMRLTQNLFKDMTMRFDRLKTHIGIESSSRVMVSRNPTLEEENLKKEFDSNEVISKIPDNHDGNLDSIKTKSLAGIFEVGKKGGTCIQLPQLF